MKKILALLVALSLALSLCACGAKAPTGDLKQESMVENGYFAADGIYDAADMEMSPEAPSQSTAGSTGSAGVQNQKLIRA